MRSNSSRSLERLNLARAMDEQRCIYQSSKQKDPSQGILTLLSYEVSIILLLGECYRFFGLEVLDSLGIPSSSLQASVELDDVRDVLEERELQVGAIGILFQHRCDPSHWLSELFNRCRQVKEGSLTEYQITQGQKTLGREKMISSLDISTSHEPKFDLTTVIQKTEVLLTELKESLVTC